MTSAQCDVDSIAINNADSIVADQQGIATATYLSDTTALYINALDCIDLSADTIIFNNADWSVFFDKLSHLEDTTTNDTTILSILHLGDSHIQAGTFTATLRQHLQHRWGNAGRGLIAPLKLTRSNEPSDFSIKSPIRWNYYRCVGRKYFNTNVGVTGIAILPTSNNIDLTFSTLSRTGDCNGYNTLRLFHAPSTNFPTLLPTDSLQDLQIDRSHKGETRYSWHKNDMTCCIQLKGKHNIMPDSVAIYGASLENGSQGIIVHEVGNNSAYYECYNNIPHYASLIATLEPQLIIISLGTNESVSATITRIELYNQIDRLITSIKRENPHALLLLTTPAENKLRKRGKKQKNGRRSYYYTENQHLVTVIETIKDYAAENNIALWDWYSIAGGKGSCERWIKEKCMARDHIHYKQQGYIIQGSLLYQSIAKAYEQYIQSTIR